MCKTQCVLALLALFVGLAHSFSWDIVVSGVIPNRLEFYNNGTLTHAEDIPSISRIFLLIYDPVHHRVLFADDSILKNFSLVSFDITTKKTRTLVRCKSAKFYMTSAYDPATETLFWTEETRIYSFSLKPGSNNAIDGNLLLNYSADWPNYMAVDSCGGYIYWSTKSEIERARFDGSEREIVVNSTVDLRLGLAIDQETQKMYWIDQTETISEHYSIESADLNGKNRRTIYFKRNKLTNGALTVSNDFIYWRGPGQHVYSQLPKNPPCDRHVEPKITTVQFGTCWFCRDIAVNYKIGDVTRDNLGEKSEVNVYLNSCLNKKNKQDATVPKFTMIIILLSLSQVI